MRLWFYVAWNAGCSVRMECFRIAVAGVCTMGTQSLLNAFVSQYYPAHVRSTGVGLANGVGRLGGMVGPTLGGALLGMKAHTHQVKNFGLCASSKTWYPF